MSVRLLLATIVLVCAPVVAGAAGPGEKLEVPAVAAAPFALLLLAIAAFPLVAEHWWHANRNKAIVTAVLCIPIAIYLLMVPNGPNFLWHGVEEYLSFIALLGALYAISGGVVLSGDLPAKPTTNIAFLAIGAVLANIVGTTGASMLLIRPMLRTNRERKNTKHIPIFFIFIVSNCGGLLTPLGDPPLFLGFLNGVDFFWTMRLWPQWLFVNGLLLFTFLIWDIQAYRREAPIDIRTDDRIREPVSIRGWKLNLPLMLGVIAAVLAKKYVTVFPVCELIMIAMAGLSVWRTPKAIRDANRFAWGPILEVAVLFAGIFVAMVPALALLNKHGNLFGITEPWQFFWVTGILSSGLDNAPTYVTMGSLAVQVGPCKDFADLAACQPALLAAVSCGAVFMGATSYIGNGPNFMVKAIAEESGYQMPSFFGYIAYAIFILMPIMIATTWISFVK